MIIVRVVSIKRIVSLHMYRVVINVPVIVVSIKINTIILCIDQVVDNGGPIVRCPIAGIDIDTIGQPRSIYYVVLYDVGTVAVLDVHTTFMHITALDGIAADS